MENFRICLFGSVSYSFFLCPVSSSLGVKVFVIVFGDW